MLKAEYIKHLAVGIGFPSQRGTPIYIDCDHAYDLATEPMQPGANGHLHAKFFTVTDRQEDGSFTILPIESENNIADLMVTWKGSENF